MTDAKQYNQGVGLSRRTLVQALAVYTGVTVAGVGDTPVGPAYVCLAPNSGARADILDHAQNRPLVMAP
jgi:hypothetical protein